jgi:ribosomal protein L11 methyltransferase
VVRHIVITVGRDDVELVSGLAWIAGAAGVEEREVRASDVPGTAVTQLIVAVEDPADLIAELGGRWPCGEVTLDADEWVESWKPWARAVVLEGLIIRPPWIETAPSGIEVVIDPGRAWGHGGHPTTRLILEMLLAGPPVGLAVLDVGCGSGVLAITAAALGAARVVAIDVDPHAVDATASNAASNAASHEVVLEVSGRPVELVEGQFDLVLANIDFPTLQQLAPAISARVGSGGQALVSGFLYGREADVVDAFAPLRVADRRQIDDWVGLRLEP